MNENGADVLADLEAGLGIDPVEVLALAEDSRGAVGKQGVGVHPDIAATGSVACFDSISCPGLYYRP